MSRRLASSHGSAIVMWRPGDCSECIGVAYVQDLLHHIWDTYAYSKDVQLSTMIAYGDISVFA